MTVVGWLAAAVALLSWPVRPRRVPPVTVAGRPVHGSGVGRAGEPVRRERRLAVTAGLAVAVAAVAVGGMPTGLVVAALGAPCAGVLVLRSERRPRRSTPDRDLALCLDLVAAVLRGGRPVAAALSSAAPAGGAAGADLHRVAALLSLGAEPSTAWGLVAGTGSALEPVAVVAVRSHASGIKLADAFEGLAADIRRECAALAGVRAGRAGVQAMAPLAACFLPSFVCLGIVPVVVGIAATVGRSLT